MRQMLWLLRSPDRLDRRLAQVHERERRTLARSQKSETKVLTDRIWEVHRAKFVALRQRQSAERQAVRDGQSAQRKDISFALAKEILIQERADIPEPERTIRRNPEQESLQRTFDKAASPEQPAKLSRAEQIRHDMEEWRKRNRDRDPGREL